MSKRQTWASELRKGEQSLSTGIFIRDRNSPLPKTLFKAIKTGVDTPVGGSTRCWPKKSADEKIGIRFDWGRAAFRDSHGLWWRILNLQLNANAESEAIRKAAQKNGTDDTRSKI
ncbi:hypothetical protein PC9H_009148 [Pleurotus ostreatus]|uniref:Uncharacterized protein n=2 Tax=Pleurotus ostreatus TaxID=5322 RepID=A0A8H7DPQ5_PLEOS|nr:uncharacterized protein PC9H_010266 [Pleurotus ostreatus]XP_036630083.1 uncharacterized protein PC9H_009148 [Pleurotus ostreatus]KDQ21990.1 hypothetical protein PLEOSDRAFT_170699 [Pleurotus ostreatus PC15]KAF7424955.1 hypothetical protein PC9H_010266 [Pleurotus ostreatus]KAF7426779.1 hypothetical protein PC9H_009148 [Pleurotus ostreatus]KAJ8694385.1 hypothetical protein PTI98_009309 [Pleurotus ostreatus]KAJ8694534.1 hypothetical protein PTI98_007198 [Pleurotus ostreatus]